MTINSKDYRVSPDKKVVPADDKENARLIVS